VLPQLKHKKHEAKRAKKFCELGRLAFIHSFGQQTIVGLIFQTLDRHRSNAFRQSTPGASSPAIM
jgi:hypothetical protein